MGAFMKLKLLAALASTLIISTIVATPLAIAQNDYRNNTASDYVTVYEHCDFRGNRRDILVGEFRKMRAVDFANDSISSLRVPNGMELTLYEHNKFRGAYARFDRDESCLNRQWNDKASSLKVSGYADNSNNRRNRDKRRNREYSNNDHGYEGRNYDNRARDNNNARGNGNVTAKNISHVTFDGKVLQQTDNANWRLSSQRGRVTQFRELRRDRETVYLQNNYTAEKVRIDLFANDVTLIDSEGRQQRYNIQRKKASLNTTVPLASNNQPNRRISQQCFDYRATSRGGEASVRFQTRESLKRFNNSTVTGRVCHKGSMTMEIGKRDANTDVVIEILGQNYRFGRNDQGNEHKNNWYRKQVQLSVGR